MSLAEVENAMLALNWPDLAALIHRGIQVLDHEDFEASQSGVDEAWRDELSARIDDIESGKVETTPAEDVFARVCAKLAARRP